MKRTLLRPLGIQIKRNLSLICLTSIVGCAAPHTTGDAARGQFEFGVLGDQQYSPESVAHFPNIMAGLNGSNLAFVVHVGDFKGGMAPPCSDRLFMTRREEFNASRHPFIYTPGDNDWTDCHATKAGGYDPVERLAKLRSIFFDTNESLGQRKLRVERQSGSAQYSKFRENARWRYGDVRFVTLHMPGENNNLGRTPAADVEYRERNVANLAWLKDSFDVAKKEGSRAVAIFTQANPLFEHRLPPTRLRLLGVAAPPAKPSGYTDFLSALESEVLVFGKPVVLVHGDTHFFRVDKPLFRSKEAGPANFGRQIENFTRMEVFGFPESHWVRVVVDVNDPHVFTFKEQVVDKNRFKKP